MNKFAELISRDRSKDLHPAESYWLFNGSFHPCDHHITFAINHFYQTQTKVGFGDLLKVFKMGWIRINLIDSVLYYSKGKEQITPEEMGLLSGFAETRGSGLMMV